MFNRKNPCCSTVAQLIGSKFFLDLSQPMKKGTLNVNEVEKMEKLEIRQSLFHVLLPASCRLLHSLNFLSFRMKIADSKTSQGIQTWCKVFSVINMQIQRCRLHVSALSTVERDQKHVWLVRCNLQAHERERTCKRLQRKTVIFFWLKHQRAAVQH